MTDDGEEEAEVEVTDDEEEEEEDEEEEDEEDEEVEEVEINNKSYYTTDTENGDIYEITDSGDIGKKVGKFNNGTENFF